MFAGAPNTPTNNTGRRSAARLVSHNGSAERAPAGLIRRARPRSNSRLSVAGNVHGSGPPCNLAVARLACGGRCPPVRKTRAAFAPKRTTQATARGTLQLRHALFRAGGLTRGGKPCGGEDCGAGRIQLNDKAAMQSAGKAADSPPPLPSESQRRSEKVHCSINRLHASGKN